jgi:hypothetical protein
MTAYHPSPLRRVHQLKGTAGMHQPVVVANQNQFAFDDLPLTMVALGKKMVNYVKAIRLVYKGQLNSVAGVTIPRKVLTPMLIASCQVQGTEIGTPVSSTHMLGGIIDTNSFLRSGGQNNLMNPTGIALSANTPKDFTYVVDIYLGNFSQNKGHQTCPLALFMKPGEILINTPATLAAVHASLTDVTFVGGSLTMTAHAMIIPSTELMIANPWQMTRHKSNAASGTDSVAVQSFGANSTLTGVQSKAGVHSMLWASSDLIGNAAGSGHVADITQFAADFLGLRQNNDPRSIVQEMFAELTDGKVIDVGGLSYDASLYPFFDVLSPLVTTADIMSMAEFFPILYPVRNFDASKLLDAVGNPSYDLTGVFAGPNHYTYVDACYPFTGDKLNDLLAVIQRNHIGLEMFGSDDLVLDTKMADSSNPMKTVAEDPSKLTYLPRIVRLRANPAVK